MNYKNLEKYGRHGDTELRKVNGRLSHVNKKEAQDIDLLGKYGEMKTQLLGSGSTNPYTGLDEYWNAKKWRNKNVKPIGKMTGIEAIGYIGTAGAVDYSGQGTGWGANVTDDGWVGGDFTADMSQEIFGKDYTGYSGWEDEKERRKQSLNALIVERF